MTGITKKIETIMYDEGRNHTGILKKSLKTLSSAYGKIMDTRNTLYSTGLISSDSLPCMVISIGNITVGGTGKTPMAIYLARLIKDLGYKVSIVSRGYGGKASKEGGIVSDGKQILLPPEMAGDEPWLMADKLRDVPVVVGSRRYEAGRVAVNTFSPDVILLDDAFQHKALNRDYDILLMDGDRPFGNGHVMPRGTLREPAKGFQRADVVILTRTDSLDDPETGFNQSVSMAGLSDYNKNIPVYKTVHKPEIVQIIQSEKHDCLSESHMTLSGRHIFAFSGIAKNHDFRKSVGSLGGTIKGYLEFADHHDYSAEDIKTIISSSEKSGADLIVTTEKDYVKLANDIPWPADIAVIGVDISFGNDKKPFDSLIENTLIDYFSRNSS